MQVRDAYVSFSTVKVLHGQMEILPKVPEWTSKLVALKGYLTSEPTHLFYRNVLDCVKYLFGNSLFANHMDFCQTRQYQDAEETIHM